MAAAKAADQGIPHVPRTHRVSRADPLLSAAFALKDGGHQLRERGTRRGDHHLTPEGSVQKRPSPTRSRKCGLPAAGSPAQRGAGVWGQSDPPPHSLKAKRPPELPGGGCRTEAERRSQQVSRPDPETGPEAHPALQRCFPGGSSIATSSTRSWSVGRRRPPGCRRKCPEHVDSNRQAPKGWGKTSDTPVGTVSSWLSLG